MVPESRPQSKIRWVLVAALLVIASLAAVLVSCGPVKRPDGGTGLLPIGSPAPDVRGEDAQGKSVHLSEKTGHAAVVYFYPKDETPGCTHEACAFRDAFDRYQAKGVTIFGISRDSANSHHEFRDKHAIPFPLVADESGAVQRAYGVSGILGMASRVTFLVGPDGKIARIWPDVDPGVHATEVLAAVETLGP